MISKTELLQGIVMVQDLTVVREGGFLTSILNMNDEEVSLSLPIADLEECEIETNPTQVVNFVAQGAVTREDRLRGLRKRIRTDHLNEQEKRVIMNICENYNDISKLPDNKLTTTAVEHVVPTSGMDPCRGIASRSYQIPEELRDELQGLIYQMLRDKIIRHPSRPWNSPFIW